MLVLALATTARGSSRASRGRIAAGGRDNEDNEDFARLAVGTSLSLMRDVASELLMSSQDHFLLVLVLPRHELSVDNSPEPIVIGIG